MRPILQTPIFMTLAYLSALAGQLDASLLHLRDLLNPLTHSPEPAVIFASSFRKIGTSEPPTTLPLSTGHVVSHHYCSPFQEILLYDTKQAPLYKEGALTFVPKESVRGIVKILSGNPGEAELVAALEELAELGTRIRIDSPFPLALAIWAPEARDWDGDTAAHLADLVAQEDSRRLTTHLVLGSTVYAQISRQSGRHHWNCFRPETVAGPRDELIAVNGALLWGAMQAHLEEAFRLPRWLQTSVAAPALVSETSTMTIPIKDQMSVLAKPAMAPTASFLPAKSSRTRRKEVELLSAPPRPTARNGSDTRQPDKFLERTLGRLGKLGRPLKAAEIRSASPVPPQESGETSLHALILQGKLEKMEEWLRSGKLSLESKDQEGNTALHIAAQSGKIPFVKCLLQHGADVNVRNFAYATPLHLAVGQGMDKVVPLLLEQGAEIESRNNRSQTPLHVAAIRGQIPTARILLEAGADIYGKMEKGVMPVHLAAWYGQGRFLQMLIQAGADLNSQNDDGNTPLHFAAFKGQVKVIKVLIRHEADTSLINSMGKTYLHGLNEGYQGEMIRLLD